MTTQGVDESVIRLTESETTLLHLGREEASALRELGKSFAIHQSEAERADDGEPVSSGRSTSVVECVRRDELDKSPESLAYAVTVANRIGAIQLAEKTILIQPKITMPHFYHLVEKSIGDPRIRFDPVALDNSFSFRDLVARWFLNAVDRLVPDHLIRDYYERSGALPAVRGCVEPLGTTKRLLSGSLLVECRYDEFELDHPLNRILKEACSRVATFATLPLELRGRARAKVEAMPEVGLLVRSDLVVLPDRRALFEGYGPAIHLAKAIIGGEGRSISSGGFTSYAFLQYTPSIIEDGIRRILQVGLGETWRVDKRSYEVTPLKSANPDLVFSREGQVRCVGDVKYKDVTEWGQVHGDVYQSIYFATAAEIHHSMIVAFSTAGESHFPQLRVGKNTVDGVLWNASKSVDPQASELVFVEDVRNVLELAD